MPTDNPPRLPDEALLRDGPNGPWLLFRRPLERLVAHRLDELRTLLVEAARRVERERLWALGWLGYEAGPAFDGALVAHDPEPPPDGLALLHLTLYPEPERVDRPPEGGGSYRTGDWRPSVSREGFGRAFDRIQEALAAGDSYQANYTFRLRSHFSGDPYGFFLDLARGQQAGYASFLGDGRRAIACASPELFFRLDGERITCRPMKGTAPRGRTAAEDEARTRALAASPKDRAENLMIVDMIRNDLGRIARPGSVRPQALFTVERYPTVLQMTSTVSAETTAPMEEIFAALFPCASITGAPKIRTTGLLRELEPEPRGIYTGAIGYLAPGRRASWAVAIRTAVVEPGEPGEGGGRVVYGVGGGIVADSQADDEWEETRVKARVLQTALPEFELLETLRWEPDRYVLLSEHLARLHDSAAYFGFAVDPERVERELTLFAGRLAPRPHKVRLLVERGGAIRIASEPLPDEEPFVELGEPAPETSLPGLRVALAPTPVDAGDPFLFHKTTHRRPYERALREARETHPEIDDVLLWNERGEITETTRFNLLVRLDGVWVTPPVASGLLAGTFRARLLMQGRVSERVVTREDLARAESVVLVNSVRGVRGAEIVGALSAPRAAPLAGTAAPKASS